MLLFLNNVVVITLCDWENMCKQQLMMECLCGKQMVSAETPMLMSKACEIFIQELTYRAWMRAEESNKSTVQPCDVAKVIMQNHAMQFLTDIVPDNLQNFCAYGAQVSPLFFLSFPLRLYFLFIFIQSLP